MRTATSWAWGIASGSTPSALEHAPSVPASARGSNSFFMWGNMTLLSAPATGNRGDAAVVVARVHHRQHDVGDGDEILPYLADAEVARGGRGETEDVERDRHAERLDAVGENRDAGLHALPLCFAALAGGEDGLRHRFF